MISYRTVASVNSIPVAAGESRARGKMPSTARHERGGKFEVDAKLDLV